TPQFTQQYFHGARITVVPDSYTSLGSDGSSLGAGEVFAFDAPKRLVHGWQSLYDPDMASEPASRVTWEIEPQDGGYCLLTVTHDQLEASPKTAESVSGAGWMMVLSGLKTLLETGKPLASFGG
ncbi:MAG TPA: SRPBCC domain-containing protein, partial [Gaiellaceae bacterium]|nr:SRPBCC domain-containing protein [Gaiellaceae bacterium]